MDVWKAANSLAAHLRSRDWYHRTSILDEPPAPTVLCVWAEKGYRDVPAEWHGYRVRVNLVSKEHLCPFGSVKP